MQKQMIIQSLFHKVTSKKQFKEIVVPFFKNTDVRVIVATAIFCALATLIPVNKAFFVTSTLYILALLYFTESIQKTFFFAFLPLNMLLIGQTYITTVIPFYELENPAYTEGRQFYFKFSPLLVLLICSLFVCTLSLFKRKGKFSFQIIHLVVIASLFFKAFSAISTEEFPTFSFTTVVFSIGIFSWLLNTQMLLINLDNRKQQATIKTFLLVLMFMTSLQNVVTLGQYVKRSTLGIFIEQSTVIPNFGQGADENGLVFRPIGLQTHANELADSTLVLVFSYLLISYWLKTKKQQIPWVIEVGFVGMSLLTVVLSQSRAAYLSLGLAVIYFFFTQFRKSQLLVKFLGEKFKVLIPVFAIAALYLVPLVTDRLLYSIYSFGERGGATVRKDLEKQAFQLIKKKPWFGVGPSMFIPAAFRQNPRYISFFPENVHNGFIMTMVEQGLISFFLQMAFIFLLIRQILLNKFDAVFKSIFGAGLVATFSMMLFHPFSNIFSNFIWLTWIVVYIQKENYEKN